VSNGGRTSLKGEKEAESSAPEKEEHVCGSKELISLEGLNFSGHERTESGYLNGRGGTPKTNLQSEGPLSFIEHRKARSKRE